MSRDIKEIIAIAIISVVVVGYTKLAEYIADKYNIDYDDLSRVLILLPGGLTAFAVGATIDYGNVTIGILLLSIALAPLVVAFVIMSLRRLFRSTDEDER